MLRQIYLADLGTRSGKPYYVFVEREESFAEEQEEVVVNYE